MAFMKNFFAVMKVFGQKLASKKYNLLILIVLGLLLIITYQKHDTHKFIISIIIAIIVCIWYCLSSYYILHKRVKKASIIYQKFWVKIGIPAINDNDDFMKKYQVINKYCIIEWNKNKSCLIDTIRLIYRTPSINFNDAKELVEAVEASEKGHVHYALDVHDFNDGILRVRRISDDKINRRDDIMTALQLYSASVEMLDFQSKIPEVSISYSGNDVVAVSYTLPAPKLIDSFNETRLVDIVNATFKHSFTLEKIDSTHYNLVSEH